MDIWEAGFFLENSMPPREHLQDFRQASPAGKCHASVPGAPAQLFLYWALKPCISQQAWDSIPGDTAGTTCGSSTNPEPRERKCKRGSQSLKEKEEKGEPLKAKQPPKSSNQESPQNRTKSQTLLVINVPSLLYSFISLRS